MLINIPGGYRPKDLCGARVARRHVPARRPASPADALRRARRTLRAARGSSTRTIPRFRDLDFEIRHRTDNYQARRGLEQRDYNDIWGDVPIRNAQGTGKPERTAADGLHRIDYDWRLDLAQQFLDLCL